MSLVINANSFIVRSPQSIYARFPYRHLGSLLVCIRHTALTENQLMFLYREQIAYYRVQTAEGRVENAGQLCPFCCQLSKVVLVNVDNFISPGVSVQPALYSLNLAQFCLDSLESIVVSSWHIDHCVIIVMPWLVITAAPSSLICAKRSLVRRLCSFTLCPCSVNFGPYY